MDNDKPIDDIARLENIFEWQDRAWYKPEILEKRRKTLFRIFNGTASLRKLYKHRYDTKNKFYNNLYFLIVWLHDPDHRYNQREAGSIMSELNIAEHTHTTKKGTVMHSNWVICKPINYEKLGGIIDLSTRSLKSYLREMERVGFIKRVGGGTGQHPALYAIGYINHTIYWADGGPKNNHSIHWFMGKNHVCMEAIENFNPYRELKKHGK